MASFFIQFPDMGLVIDWVRKGWTQKRCMK